MIFSTEDNHRTLLLVPELKQEGNRPTRTRHSLDVLTCTVGSRVSVSVFWESVNEEGPRQGPEMGVGPSGVVSDSSYLYIERVQGLSDYMEGFGPVVIQ